MGDDSRFFRKLVWQTPIRNGAHLADDRGTRIRAGTRPFYQRTKARFDKYGRSDLLCGADGLPHLIADGRPSHAAEFIFPGFGFIYISGWIGWVGRKYLRAVSTTKNPSESEIIINVPLALKIMTTGYIWPISAWQELISGDLVAKKDEITVSPR